MDAFRKLNIPSDPGRFPVLTGKKIPGKAPELAEKLRLLADQLEDLANELDDCYEMPFDYGHRAVFYGDVMTWGSQYEPPEDDEA